MIRCINYGDFWNGRIFGGQGEGRGENSKLSTLQLVAPVALNYLDFYHSLVSINGKKGPQGK
jgi:hypothetical protein